MWWQVPNHSSCEIMSEGASIWCYFAVCCKEKTLLIVWAKPLEPFVSIKWCTIRHKVRMHMVNSSKTYGLYANGAYTKIPTYHKFIEPRKTNFSHGLMWSHDNAIFDSLENLKFFHICLWNMYMHQWTFALVLLWLSSVCHSLNLPFLIFMPHKSLVF